MGYLILILCWAGDDRNKIALTEVLLFFFIALKSFQFPEQVDKDIPNSS